MPTYDYECDACQHKFEIFQNMSDELLTKCPKCKKKKLRRLFGAGAAVMSPDDLFSPIDVHEKCHCLSFAHVLDPVRHVGGVMSGITFRQLATFISRDQADRAFLNRQKLASPLIVRRADK